MDGRFPNHNTILKQILIILHSQNLVPIPAFMLIVFVLNFDRSFLEKREENVGNFPGFSTLEIILLHFFESRDQMFLSHYLCYFSLS